jgi:hypothetical protein
MVKTINTHEPIELRAEAGEKQAKLRYANGSGNKIYVLAIREEKQILHVQHDKQMQYQAWYIGSKQV